MEPRVVITEAQRGDRPRSRCKSWDKRMRQRGQSFGCCLGGALWVECIDKGEDRLSFELMVVVEDTGHRRDREKGRCSNYIVGRGTRGGSYGAITAMSKREPGVGGVHVAWCMQVSIGMGMGLGMGHGGAGPGLAGMVSGRGRKAWWNKGGQSRGWMTVDGRHMMW